MKLLPTLYKKTSTGADQEWTISVVAETDAPDTFAQIVTKFGQIGGKIQCAVDVVKEGKNLGKKNETTALQQAEAEAQSQWEKKLKKGYVETLDDARAGKTDEVIEGGIFPMLAHKFSEQGHKIVYPAFAQPKFDGHRCIAVVKDGKATLWTRTRKEITGLPHIVLNIETLSKKLGLNDFVLDGELYNHRYKSRFEELSSFIRTPEPKEGCEVVQYHVYDKPHATALQFERMPIIEAIRVAYLPFLVGVETISVADEDELMAAFEKFRAAGYEGLMVRNVNGQYVNKRSYDLQKVKEFDDAEFYIVDVEEGRGKLAGHAIFVCTTARREGVHFRVKMKGKIEDLKKYFEHPELAIGRLLTVKYQGITNKSGVPRFPVGERFRED
jgi:ATP-dependent DNA ligase